MNLGRSFLLVIAAAFLLVVLSACSRQPHYRAPERMGQDVVIDAAGLKPDIPVFYTYSFQGKAISFFVFRSGDRILSYLDACANCYVHKRGYEYKEDSVVCRHCGTQFPVSKLETGLGSCYPIKLEGRLEQGKYLVSVAKLEAAAEKF